MVFIGKMKKSFLLLSLRLLSAKLGASLLPPHPSARAGEQSPELSAVLGTLPAAPGAGIHIPSMGMSQIPAWQPCCCSPTWAPALWRCCTLAGWPVQGKRNCSASAAKQAPGSPKRREGKSWFDPSPLCNPPTLPSQLGAPLPARAAVVTGKKYNFIKTNSRLLEESYQHCDFWGKLQKYSLLLNVGNSPQCIPW